MADVLMRESARVLTALGAAMAGGIAIGVSGSTSLLRAADLIAPVGTLWVSAIQMTVIPLVVSLLITGVASTADLRTIGRLGGRALVVFLLLLAGTTIVMVPIMAKAATWLASSSATRPALPPGAIEAASELSAEHSRTFAAWLTSLIPSNPVAAAATGQMVPLILFTVFLALAIARGSSAARVTLVGFFQALGDAMLTLVRWVILAAPVGVFALVLPLAARAGGELAGAIGVYMIGYMIASLAASALQFPVVAMMADVPVGRFARAALPSQLIGFSASSSIATLPAMIRATEEGMGLPPRVIGFVLPLAVSVFKLAVLVSWTAGALFVGWFYGVPLGMRELATIGAAAVFLGFAAPGVPRGAFILLTPLFQAVGLPPEGIGILIAVDAIPDTCATVLNVTGDLAAAAIVAKGEASGQPLSP